MRAKIASCVLLVCLFLVGCQTPRPIYVERPVKYNWKDHLEADDLQIINWMEQADYKKLILWKAETITHLNGDVIVFGCHGMDIGGDWLLAPRNGLVHLPASLVARELSEKYKGQIVLMVVCNSGGYKLYDAETPLYYAIKNVWMIPNRYVSENSLRFYLKPDTIGDIIQFEQTMLREYLE